MVSRMIEGRNRRSGISLLLLFPLVFSLLSGCLPPPEGPKGPVPEDELLLPIHELIILPPLPGDIYAEARGMNDSDPLQIVGISRSTDNTTRAVRWTYDGNVSRAELYPLPGHAGAEANDINDDGKACGLCRNAATNGDPRPVFWNDVEPFDIFSSTYPVPGQVGSAISVTNNDIIAGWFEPIPPRSDSSTRPFAYLMGIVDPLYPHFDATSRFTNTSLNGFVSVGYEEPTERLFVRDGFYFTPYFGKQVISNAPAFDARSIAEGQIAITGVLLLGGKIRPYIYYVEFNENEILSTRPVDIGPLGDWDYTAAYALNSSETVVGGAGDNIPQYVSRSKGDVAFIWTQSSGLVDLNELVEESEEEYLLRWAADINESGYITGGCVFEGAAAGFLLIPREMQVAEMVKTGPAEAEQGGVVEYTFEITNPTDQLLVVSISDPLPAGTAFDPTIPQSYIWTLQGGYLQATLTVPAGSDARVTLNLRVTGEPGTEIVNDAFSYTYEGVGPVYPGESVVTTIVESVHTIEIEMTKTGPPLAETGEMLEYNFLVRNNSSEEKTVEITDPLPVGTSFDPGLQQAFPWTFDGTVVTVDVVVPASAEMRVPLRLRISGEPGETIVNNAYGFSYDVYGPYEIYVPVTTLITPPQVYVQMFKSGPESVYEGDIFEYIFSVENFSIPDITVIITDPIPTGAVFDQSVIQDFPWIIDGQAAVLVIRMIAGQSRNVVLRLRATGDPGSIVRNSGYSIAVNGGVPEVTNIPVDTEILPSIPVEIPGGRDDGCILIGEGEYASLEPDMEAIGAEFDRVDYYVGLQQVLSTSTEPYTWEWRDVPAGIHPAHYSVYSGGSLVFESGCTIIVSKIHPNTAGDHYSCYELEWLDVPQEDRRGKLVDINDDRDIVGYLDYISHNPFRLVDGEFDLIPMFSAHVFDITENGTVYGTFANEILEGEWAWIGYRITPDGNMELITHPEGGPTMIFGGRDNGQAVGTWYDPEEISQNCGGYDCHPGLIWQDGTVHLLLDPDGSEKCLMRAQAITERGFVIGRYDLWEPAYSGTNFFIWEAPDDLSGLGSGSSNVTDLVLERFGSYVREATDRGYVLIRTGSHDTRIGNLYKYDPDNPELPVKQIIGPCGDMDVNDWGMVAGFVTHQYSYDTEATISVCDMSFDLNLLIPEGTGWKLLEAQCINDDGVIAGLGTDEAGVNRLFILTPVR